MADRPPRIWRPRDRRGEGSLRDQVQALLNTEARESSPRSYSGRAGGRGGCLRGSPRVPRPIANRSRGTAIGMVGLTSPAPWTTIRGRVGVPQHPVDPRALWPLAAKPRQRPGLCGTTRTAAALGESAGVCARACLFVMVMPGTGGRRRGHRHGRLSGARKPVWRRDRHIGTVEPNETLCSADAAVRVARAVRVRKGFPSGAEGTASSVRTWARGRARSSTRDRRHHLGV